MAARLPILPLVARGLPSLESLGDAGRFAWEILRRRADYSSGCSAVDADVTACTSGTVDFLTSRVPDPSWGLQFRRRS